MKIKQGFISNSSSSSFVCIVKKLALDNMLKDKSDFHKMVISRTGEEQQFGDEKVVILEHISGERGTSFVEECGFWQEDLPAPYNKEPEWNPMETEEIVYNAWTDITRALEKLPANERIIMRRSY
jgi:hypothetical protein